MDPNLEEEAAASGLMTVIMNAFGELCAVQKTSGIGLPAAEVQSSACRLTLLTARLNFGSRPVPIAGCCPRQRFPRSQSRTFDVSELLACVTVLLCKSELRYRGTCTLWGSWSALSTFLVARPLCSCLHVCVPVPVALSVCATSVFMFVYVCVCASAFICLRILCVHVCVCVCLCQCFCLSVHPLCSCLCMYVSVSLPLSVSASCVFMYVYVCVCASASVCLRILCVRVCLCVCLCLSQSVACPNRPSPAA